MKKLILIALSSLFVLSCAKEQETKMDFSFNSKEPVLNYGTTTSCAATTADDVKAAYFQLQGAVLSWKGVGSSAFVNTIRFKISGGPFKDKVSAVSGKEIDALYGANARLIPSATKAANDTVTPQTVAFACNLIVGSLPVTDAQNVPFQALVTGSIEGTEIDDVTKEESPFQTLFYFTLTNKGNQF